MRAGLPMLLASIALALAPALAVGFAPASSRAEGWHSAQPPAPPPPEGQSGVSVPVPLGPIGDIEFWAPNRGLLITGGNSAIPAGLYYYDGVSWHQLSTVCGGGEGRIAWAGPDNFWTVSDQQAGQQVSSGGPGPEDLSRSLCHFVDGQVVASYAEPIGVPGSYQRMDAAACSGEDDCWFGGERLPNGVNRGGFHLHWNGSTLTALPSLEVIEPQLEDPARKVGDIAAYHGRFYESVQPEQDDPPSETESPQRPFLLHRIVEGASKPFVPLLPEGPPGEPFTYGSEEVQPWQLSAFRLSGDALGLWALAGPDGLQPEGSSPPQAQATALLASNGEFRQIKLSDPSGALTAPGDLIGGFAAEPGTSGAWVSVDPLSEKFGGHPPARLARIEANGEVEPQLLLPEAGEAVGRKGSAGAISCPAQNDCWLATSEGWLFHLGGTYPRDEDPSFQSLISYRPRDASIPFAPPDQAPPDTSGDNPVSIASPPSSTAPTPTPGEREPLFSHTRVRLLKGTTLLVTFTLATRSRVQLLALRGKRRVAATAHVVLGRGRRSLKLRLKRTAWPTKLDLLVRALAAVPLVPSGSGGAGTPGGANSITTPLREPISALTTTTLP